MHGSAKMAVVSIGCVALAVASTALAQVHRVDRTNHYILECDGDRCLAPAQKAIGEPHSIALDPDGNLFILSQNIVFKLAPDGVLTRFAGDGIPGDRGDGGPALDARISAPLENCDVWIFLNECWRPDGSITTDASGTVYFTDGLNRTIRRVDPDGTIATVADSEGRPIRLEWILGLAASGDGSLYIVTYDQGILRREVDGTVVVAVAPASWNDLDADGAHWPDQAAIDAAGSLYFTDAACRIRRWSKAGGTVTVAGEAQPLGYACSYGGDDGPAIDARFGFRLSLAIDGGGRVYVADTEHHCIRRIGTDGAIAPVAGTCTSWPLEALDQFGPPPQARLVYPRAVAVGRDGAIYVADTMNRRIVRFGGDGAMAPLAGNGFPLVVMDVRSATTP
jgi:sugar lactone lactonase YvrE